MTENKDLIHVQTELSKLYTRVTSTYKESQIIVIWRRDQDDSDVRRQLSAIIGKVPEIVNDALREALIHDESAQLDTELTQLFSQEDK